MVPPRWGRLGGVARYSSGSWRWSVGGGVVGEVVEAGEVEVVERVLDAPAGAGGPDQRAGAGGGLAGEDLQRGLAAFEQGDLPVGPVVVDGDGLIGVADLGGLPAAGQG